MTLRANPSKSALINTAFIRSQLKTYDLGKGYLKKYVYTELPDIAHLRAFYESLPHKDSDRSLTPIELKNLFLILVSAKTVPSHLSDEIFTELKKVFGLELIKNLSKLEEKGILTQDNFDLVLMHSQPARMTTAILKLHANPEINTAQNRLRLKDSPEPEKLVETMETSTSLYELLKLYNINASLYQKVIETCPDLSSLYGFLKMFSSKKEIEEALVHANPLKMAAALAMMGACKATFTQQNRQAVKNSDDPEVCAKTIHAKSHLLDILKNTELDLPEYISAIEAHSDVVALKESLLRLEPSQLTVKNFKILINHPNPVSMASALITWENCPEINTVEYLEAAINDADPDEYLFKRLANNTISQLLTKAKINTADNRYAVNNHPDSTVLKKAVETLSSFSLLDQTYFDIIVTHANPTSMSIGIVALYYANKMVEMNLDDKLALIRQEDDPSKVAMALVVQRVLGIAKASSILTYIITTISGYVKEDLMEFCDSLIKEVFTQSVNFSQNTHVESVYKSASKSAQRLLNRYEKRILLEKDTEEIKKWAQSLDRRKTSNNSEVLNAAQKAVEGLVKVKYLYSDPASKISLHKLLVLIWTAIHDKEVLTCSLEEAERLFIEGLYEIIRGDNLNEKMIDDGADDKTICKSGAFNKLIEKLAGIHPDAQIIFMTKQTASWKLPVAVKNQIFKQLSQPRTQQELEYSLEMINKLELNGVIAIWDKIKEDVANEIYEEYGSLFKGKNDEEFTNMIAKGNETNFMLFQAQLKSQISKSPAVINGPAGSANNQNNLFQPKSSVPVAGTNIPSATHRRSARGH